ncbi:DNA methyltransferase [Geodermatophilus sp. SYSU D00700]
MTLLETAFPFHDVSRLVAADRRAPDPAYQAHRWWARRPPALVRAALLAASLPGDTPAATFWRAYATPGRHLTGMNVLDPFLGGGTTLVEAARLGARVIGTDVDPLAVLLNEHQAQPAAIDDVHAAGGQLLTHLHATLNHLWPEVADADGSRWTPLHYFWLAQVTCPECAHTAELYKSLIIARSIGRPGSVRRTTAVTAFCPQCLALHALHPKDTTLTCCGQVHPVSSGTFRAGRYTCPHCARRSSHEQLQTGAAPRVLLAVEDAPLPRDDDRPSTHAPTVPAYRRIRPPRLQDRAAVTAGDDALAAITPDPVHVKLVATADDARPLSFGITTVGALHTARQLAYLGSAQAWIDAADNLPAPVTRALRLALSTTITSNNRMCGYATDYGRLAPLFSVRAFALPWLTVELNPLHRTGGRGTLAAALTRVARSCEDTVRRHVLTGRGRLTPLTMTLTRTTTGHQVAGADATAAPTDTPPTAARIDVAAAHLVFTDPPYFDFISYDALSQIFRAWQPQPPLCGRPLLPDGDDPVEAFGLRLGTALTSATARCRPDGLLAFTYKGGDDAWDAVGIALDEAKLRVTALWPVLADPHMGHHAHAGNCEYDLLVVARPLAATVPRTHDAPDTAALLNPLRRRSLTVSDADRSNIRSAVRIARPRWGATAPLPIASPPATQ